MYRTNWLMICFNYICYKIMKLKTVKYEVRDKPHDDGYDLLNFVSSKVYNQIYRETYREIWHKSRSHPLPELR